jgi:MGT family glycosyltransferase
VHPNNRGSFLITTFEAGGTVAPALTVGRKLAAAGHKVRVMSDMCNRREAEQAGLIFRPWTAAPSRAGRGREHDLFEDWVGEPIEGFQTMLDVQLVGRAADYASDVTQELRREPADLVISADMLFGVQMACEAIAQRFVLFAANICLFPILPGVPPLGPGLAPAQTPENAAFEAEIAAGFEALLDARLPVLNAARAGLCLPPLTRFLDQPLAAEKILLGTAPSFDFPCTSLPEKVSYVGPQLADGGWAEPWRNPVEGETKPLALVAFSTTFQNHAGVVQRVVDAISRLPMNAVVTLGSGIQRSDVSGAENVAIMDSAPHTQILAEADLAITHGGHGTLLKAVAEGLPVLIIPHGRDQADNAVRVTERGAGLSLPPSASTEEIEHALARLLRDEDINECAKRLGAAVSRDMETLSVVSAIEALAFAKVRAATDGEGETAISMAELQSQFISPCTDGHCS